MHLHVIRLFYNPRSCPVLCSNHACACACVVTVLCQSDVLYTVERENMCWYT
jgi:hypothetical protein